jgi:uncharacterized membrane protein
MALASWLRTWRRRTGKTRSADYRNRQRWSLALEPLEHRWLCTYSITDLGTFGGTISDGWGINNQGEAVGSAYLDCNCMTRGFLWGGNARHQLDNQGALGINDLGQVIGTSYDVHPCLWSRQGGTVQLDFVGSPYAINNRGEFVGKMFASGHPFL